MIQKIVTKKESKKMSICSRIFAACSLVLLTSAGAFGASVFPGVVRTSAGEADFTIELTPEEYAAVKAEPRAILYVARNDRRLRLCRQ